MERARKWAPWRFKRRDSTASTRRPAPTAGGSVDAFLAQRDELAAGHGVLAAVAHSPVAARQWVSDELAQSACAVTAHGRAAGPARLDLVRAAGLLTALALVAAVTVTARLVVTTGIAAGRLQKVRADRPRAADLLCDDSGRACLADVQYLLVSGTVLLLAAVGLARDPVRLPEVPWSLVLLLGVSPDRP